MIMAADELGESKSVYLSPDDALRFGKEVIEVAYEAAGLKDFDLMLAVAYDDPAGNVIVEEVE